MQKRPVKKDQPNSDPAHPAPDAPNAEKVPTKEIVEESRRDAEREEESPPTPSSRPRPGTRRPEEQGAGKHNR